MIKVQTVVGQVIKQHTHWFIDEDGGLTTGFRDSEADEREQDGAIDYSLPHAFFVAGSWHFFHDAGDE